MKSIQNIAVIATFLMLVLVARNLTSSDDNAKMLRQEKTMVQNLSQQVEMLNKKLDELGKVQGEQTKQLETLDGEIRQTYFQLKPATAETPPPITQTGAEKTDQKPGNWLKINKNNLEDAAQEFGEWLKTNGFPSPSPNK